MSEKERLTPNGVGRNGRNGLEADPACGSRVAKAPGIPMGTTG